MADVIFTGVSIQPNPVQTGKSFIISVDIRDKIYAIANESGQYLLDTDGEELIISK